MEWLIAITEPVVVAIDCIALLVVAFGSLQAFVHSLKFLMTKGAPDSRRRAIWMQYSHWLVAALTFQLAADIVESSIAPDWDTIGQLAAIAVIRTFLNYFLEKDADEYRELDERKE